MKNNGCTWIKSLLVAAAVLSGPAAVADTTHHWAYEQSGHYGYVTSQYTNICEGKPWQNCQNLLWLSYDGSVQMADLKANNPSLYQAIASTTAEALPGGNYANFFAATPTPTQLVFGSGVGAVRFWVVIISVVAPTDRVHLHPVAGVMIKTHVEGSVTTSPAQYSNDSVPGEAYADVQTGAIAGSSLNTADLAQIGKPFATGAGAATAAPAHWWAYDVDGRYGYVNDSSDPTCTPDWTACKKPITWLLYDGERSDKTQVFTLFKSPTELDATENGQASPVQFSASSPNGDFTTSYLMTDGSEMSQDDRIPYRSAIWFAMDDASHNQLTPSQLSDAQKTQFAGAAQQSQKARGAFMGQAFQSWMNEQRVRIENGN